MSEFMFKKGFHPKTRKNRQRVADAERKEQERQKRERLRELELRKERLSWDTLSDGERKKQSMSFMYQTTPSQPPNGSDNGRPRELHELSYKEQRALPLALKINLRNSDRPDRVGLDYSRYNNPLGVAVRNVKCFKCGQWGHDQTERVCPLYGKLRLGSEIADRNSFEDPAVLMERMRQTDGLVLSRYSRQRQIDRTAENQQLIPEPATEKEEEKLTLRAIKRMSTKEKRQLLKELEAHERDLEREERRRLEHRQRLEERWARRQRIVRELYKSGFANHEEFQQKLTARMAEAATPPRYYRDDDDASGSNGEDSADGDDAHRARHQESFDCKEPLSKVPSSAADLTRNISAREKEESGDRGVVHVTENHACKDVAVEENPRKRAKLPRGALQRTTTRDASRGQEGSGLASTRRIGGDGEAFQVRIMNENYRLKHGHHMRPLLEPGQYSYDSHGPAAPTNASSRRHVQAPKERNSRMQKKKRENEKEKARARRSSSSGGMVDDALLHAHNSGVEGSDGEDSILLSDVDEAALFGDMEQDATDEDDRVLSSRKDRKHKKRKRAKKKEKKMKDEKKKKKKKNSKEKKEKKEKKKSRRDE